MSIPLFKQSSINEIIVGIADDATGVPVTGLVFSDVSVKISKEAQVGQTTKTLSGSDWHEIGDGWYRLKLSAADTDTVGMGMAVATFGASKAGFPFQVAAPTAGDALEASVQAVKAKTDNLPTNPASQTNLDVAVSSRLATGGYTAPDNAGIAQARNAALGMFVVLGVPTFNPSTPDLATVRVRLYDNQAHANADDGATGLIVQFTRTVTYSATAISGTAHQFSKVVGA